MRLEPLITVLVLASLSATAAPASAAVCGAPQPEDAATARGTLTLDDRASTVRRDFQRESGARTLQLVFDVANCEVREPPTVNPGPLKDVDEEIPGEALGRPRSEERRV